MMGNPVAFEIFGHAIRWYGIMAACGFVAATFVLHLNRKYAEMSSSNIYDFAFWIMISAVIGARLFYVIQFWNEGGFNNNFLKIIRVDQGGIVFFGGFISALFFIIFYCRIKKFQFLKVLDITAPALALGHAFGRVGCFINGCCYGKVCSCSWAVNYPANSSAGKYLQNQQMLNSLKTGRESAFSGIHPVQLYESIGNVIIFLLLSILIRKWTKRKSGFIAALYLILYAVLRFMDEFLRGDHQDFVVDILTPAQFIAIFTFIVGVIIMIYLNLNNKQSNENAEIEN